MIVPPRSHATLAPTGKRPERSMDPCTSAEGTSHCPATHRVFALQRDHVQHAFFGPARPAVIRALSRFSHHLNDEETANIYGIAMTSCKREVAGGILGRIDECWHSRAVAK